MKPYHMKLHETPVDILRYDYTMYAEFVPLTAVGTDALQEVAEALPQTRVSGSNLTCSIDDIDAVESRLGGVALLDPSVPVHGISLPELAKPDPVMLEVDAQLKTITEDIDKRLAVTDTTVDVLQEFLAELHHRITRERDRLYQVIGDGGDV